MGMFKCVESDCEANPFSRKKTWLRHYRNVHQTTAQWPIECPVAVCQWFGRVTNEFTKHACSTIHRKNLKTITPYPWRCHLRSAPCAHSRRKIQTDNQLATNRLGTTRTLSPANGGSAMSHHDEEDVDLRIWDNLKMAKPPRIWTLPPRKPHNIQAPREPSRDIHSHSKR